MKKGISRRELEVTDLNEIIKILDRSKIVHVAMVDEGRPYMVTMNYVYTFEEGKLKLYLHGAHKGRKIDVMKANPDVFVEIECDIEPFSGDLPCQYGMAYASIMGEGKAVIVEDVQDKMEAMSILMKSQTGMDFSFNERLVSIVTVIRIDVDEFTAKKREMPPMATSQSMQKGVK